MMQKKLYSDKSTIAATQNKKEREYWLRKMDGEPVKSVFPYDFSYEIDAGTDNLNDLSLNSLRFSIGNDIFTKAVKISGGSDVRLHMILAATLTILLSKYTGSRDILIGSPILKQKKEAEFVNRVLVFRSDIQKEATFKQILMQMKDTISEAAEHQNFPIEVLPKLLKLPYTDYGFPLFDTVFVLENIQDKSYMKGYQYNILFNFKKDNDSFQLEIDYHFRRYREATICQIVGHLERLLKSLLNDVNNPVDNIDILSKDERLQLLETFNGKDISFSTDKTFHWLFDEQVSRSKDNIAVIGKSKGVGDGNSTQEYGQEMVTLTYEQLSRKAEKMAVVLREHGVNSDTVVAVMAERSPLMIVGVLAILKAGGAYLPIDPQYPPDRIKFMLNDSRAEILVTQPHLEVLAGFEGTVINIEQEYENNLDSTLPHVSDSTDLAYVIYTSGSTGMPKGVMVQHNHWVNVAGGWRLEYRLQEMEVNLLQMASFSFDVFAGDLARTLLNGGKMVINPEAAVAPEVLYGLIRENRVSLFESTPSYIIPFMNHVYENNLPIEHLKLLILGSDICPVGDFKQLLTRFGKQMRIVNSYGVTEATIDSSFYEETDPKNVQPYGSVPIGKPLPNMIFYILDLESGEQLLPIGVPGELYIGGKSVTRGYLFREELTAQRFLSDPFSQDSQARMYKTGDLARWLPDGNVEFIGRSDSQVKVRGYRIELGEIENRLLEHKNVKEAVVLAKDDDDGDKYLCAYFVPNIKGGERLPNKNEFREYLARTLPDYMVPWFFMVMEKMPLTPNGKIDRKAMPEPEASEQVEYVAPRNAKEEELVRVFADVLGGDADTIGIDSTFFDLGGNSLKAIILITKIHKQFSVKVELMDIFEKQTVRKLAYFIDHCAEEEYIAIKPAKRKDYYALSGAQKRFYIQQQMFPQTTRFNMSQNVVIRDDIDKDTFERICRQLIQRHESLRTAFVVKNGEPLQKILPDVDFSVEYFDLTEMKMEDAKSSAKEAFEEIRNKVRRPFDLASPPLFHAAFIKTQMGSNVLFIDMHHIISDQVSLQIVARDISSLYSGQPLPPLNLQYKDYSEWRNTPRQQELLKKQENYWLNQFVSPLPQLALLTDFTRPAIQESEGKNYIFRVGHSNTIALKELARKEGASMQMLLLSVLYVLLAKMTGQDDIVVGTPSVGRNHADLENIIGVFVNTLALRSFPKEDKTFLAFFREVKHISMEAYKNQDYQFDELVKKINLPRDVSRNPLFDVMFELASVGGDIQANGKGNQENQRISEENNGADQLNSDSGDSSYTESRLDLDWFGFEGNSDVFFTVIYGAKLFKRKTIERMVEKYKEIIGQILKDPEIKLMNIKISQDFITAKSGIVDSDDGDFGF